MEENKLSILVADQFTAALADLFEENPRAGFSEVYHLIKTMKEEVTFKSTEDLEASK